MPHLYSTLLNVFLSQSVPSGIFLWLSSLVALARFLLFLSENSFGLFDVALDLLSIGNFEFRIAAFICSAGGQVGLCGAGLRSVADFSIVRHRWPPFTMMVLSRGALQLAVLVAANV